jgi:hypothetical protein
MDSNTIKLNKKNKKNNEKYKENDKNKIQDKPNSRNYNFSNIKTTNGYNCIGPCYPANTIYYNPSTLTAIKSKFTTCPIKKQSIEIDNKKEYIFADRCDISEINDEYLYFDIFDDSVQIANSPNDFLKQIYKIFDISDVIIFLNNSIDIIPIYSQKRILKAIYEIYYKYIEFPKLFFSGKISKILTEIYKLKKIDPTDIISDLDKIKLNKQDIFLFLAEKYSHRH